MKKHTHELEDHIHCGQCGTIMDKIATFRYTTQGIWICYRCNIIRCKTENKVGRIIDKQVSLVDGEK